MDNGWLTEDTFSCFVPAQIVTKSGGKGPEGDGKRWIQGIASTDARDLQGEIINQGGIDFSYFLTHGYFNDDHKAEKVGEPTEAKLTKNGLWVKGFLYKNTDPTKESKSDYYWKMMNDLAASGSSRKVGFSIQGKVLRRNGNKIEKCWIQEIAVTTQPVNTATWAEIAKSLAAQKWDLVKDTDEDDKKKEAEKALSAGGACAVESLEGKKKDVVTVKSLLTHAEACDLVKSETGLTDEDAVKAIVNIAFGLFGQE
jgi:hypothetical protein